MAGLRFRQLLDVRSLLAHNSTALIPRAARHNSEKLHTAPAAAPAHIPKLLPFHHLRAISGHTAPVKQDGITGDLQGKTGEFEGKSREFEGKSEVFDGDSPRPTATTDLASPDNL